MTPCFAFLKRQVLYGTLANGKFVIRVSSLYEKKITSFVSVADLLILKKKISASACRKKKIACSTNVIESLWEKISCPPDC